MYIVKRSPNNPILEPSSQRAWEGAGVMNGCPVKKGKEIHLVYRALGKPDPLVAPGVYLSSIGKAVSHDGGEHFNDRVPFVTATEEWDRFGCEDPRVTYFEGRYYIFYTAISEVPFKAEGIRIACAISDDLDTVAEKHLVTPFNGKAMTLFPERVNGKATVIFTAHSDESPHTKMCIAQAEEVTDFFKEEYWKEWHEHIDEHAVSFVRSGNDFTEVGAPPIKTDEGWLVVYSYVHDYFNEGERLFSIEAALLDVNDPRKITARTHTPIIIPEEPYEMYGVVKKVAFPSGALLDGNKLDIYYGAGDTVCAKASVVLPHLLDAMLEERYHSKAAVRFGHNPILSPDSSVSWRARAVLNPAAVDLDGTVYILFRAMSPENTSTFGLIESKDGVHIDYIHPDPVYVPRAEFEQKKGSPTGNSGCEDPRLVRVGDTLHLFYTAYDGVNHPHIAISSISVADFLGKKWGMWKEPVLISPAQVPDKDAAVFPEKIDGKYLLIHRIDPIICADYFTDLNFTEFAVKRCIEIAHPRPATWEHKKVGIAGEPFLTGKGWLQIYHAVSKDNHYCLGAMLLEKDNPINIIGRLAVPILTPEKEYEKEGEVSNVVFSCGQVIRGDTLHIYYGGADKFLCGATLSLSHLLKRLDPEELH